MNRYLNALIALLENRPSEARDMIRESPELGGVAEVIGRLYGAIEARDNVMKGQALLKLMRDSLQLQPVEQVLAKKLQEEGPLGCYYQGVRDLEVLAERTIQNLLLLARD